MTGWAPDDQPGSEAGGMTATRVAAAGIGARHRCGILADPAVQRGLPLRLGRAQVNWLIQRYRAMPEEMAGNDRDVADGRRLEAAGFDGPLQPGFNIIGRYRNAEQMLTRRIGVKIGKPGQAHAPVGRLLNNAANECVRLCPERCDVAPATTRGADRPKGGGRGFPTALPWSDARRSHTSCSRSEANRSDVYFQLLAPDGTLQRLVRYLLPGRATLRCRSRT